MVTLLAIIKAVNESGRCWVQFLATPLAATLRARVKVQILDNIRQSSAVRPCSSAMKRNDFLGMMSPTCLTDSNTACVRCRIQGRR